MNSDFSEWFKIKPFLFNLSVKMQFFIYLFIFYISKEHSISFLTFYLIYSVTQGAILGLVLFNLYMLSLGYVIRKYTLQKNNKTTTTTTKTAAVVARTSL